MHTMCLWVDVPNRTHNINVFIISHIIIILLDCGLHVTFTLYDGRIVVIMVGLWLYYSCGIVVLWLCGE